MAEIPEKVEKQLREIFPEIKYGELQRSPSLVSPWLGYTHPVFFYLVLTNMTPEWFMYEPETIESMVKDNNPSNRALNMLFALKACLRSDMAWNSVHAFNNVAISFSGDIPETDTLEEIYPNEAEFAVDTLRRVDPNREFSEDVLIYIKENNKLFHGFDGAGMDMILYMAKKLLPDLMYHYGGQK